MKFAIICLATLSPVGLKRQPRKLKRRSILPQKADFCAVHESAHDPKRRSGNVRYSAALGVKADVTLTSQKRH